DPGPGYALTGRRILRLGQVVRNRVRAGNNVAVRALESEREARLRRVVPDDGHTGAGPVAVTRIRGRGRLVAVIGVRLPVPPTADKDRDPRVAVVLVARGVDDRAVDRVQDRVARIAEGVRHVDREH